MPPSCCEPDYDAMFNERAARQELARYRRTGAEGSTGRLIDVLEAAGVRDASLLDIGGGIGAIGIELLAAGARSLTNVDASRPYLSVARTELDRRGLVDRATFHHGDFVALADRLGDADVVTLDRVICCYRDWPALVDRSVARARRLYGLVIPNERWWMRIAIGIGNLLLRLRGQSYRGYIHPERPIDERIRRAGFRLRTHDRGWVWQTLVYERVT